MGTGRVYPREMGNESVERMPKKPSPAPLLRTHPFVISSHVCTIQICYPATQQEAQEKAKIQQFSVQQSGQLSRYPGSREDGRPGGLLLQ